MLMVMRACVCVCVCVCVRARARLYFCAYGCLLSIYVPFITFRRSQQTCRATWLPGCLAAELIPTRELSSRNRPNQLQAQNGRTASGCHVFRHVTPLVYNCLPIIYYLLRCHSHFLHQYSIFLYAAAMHSTSFWRRHGVRYKVRVTIIVILLLGSCKMWLRAAEGIILPSLGNINYREM